MAKKIEFVQTYPDAGKALGAGALVAIVPILQQQMDVERERPLPMEPKAHIMTNTNRLAELMAARGWADVSNPSSQSKYTFLVQGEEADKLQETLRAMVDEEQEEEL